MSDWKGSVVARTESRVNLFIAHDTSIRSGFPPEECRLMLKSATQQAGAGIMWPVYELWLDEDRPL
jgi:hypothetical protein